MLVFFQFKGMNFNARIKYECGCLLKNAIFELKKPYSLFNCHLEHIFYRIYKLWKALTKG